MFLRSGIFFFPVNSSAQNLVCKKIESINVISLFVVLFSMVKENFGVEFCVENVAAILWGGIFDTRPRLAIFSP